MFSTECLYAVLSDYLNRSGGIVYAISPFIDPEVLARCMADRVGTDVIIVSSWRPSFLVQGVSTLELFPLCRERGWTLLVNDRLHAKFYSHSLESAWMGSANVTRSGLGLAEEANLEAMSFIEPLSRAARVWVHRLVSRSRLVTEDLYELLRDWLETQPSPAELELGPPPLRDEKSPDPFLTNQLPSVKSPQLLWEVLVAPTRPHSSELVVAAEHDIGIFEVEEVNDQAEFSDALSRQFFAHPFVTALAQRVDSDGARFGKVKEWIQDTCTDVPVPYRRELTENTQALYNWFVDLAPDVYEVVQPRHTQILRRKGSLSGAPGPPA